jgi:hypothetical protein
MTRTFKPVPTFASGVNISDSVLIVEGGLPGWRTFDAEKDRQQYEAEKAEFGAAAMASAMPCTPETQTHAPMADAFAKPLTPPPAPRTVRRFATRPRAGEADGADFKITKIIGGLPDWLHQAEARQRAQDEHAAQLEAAKNIAPTLAQPEAARPPKR